MDNENPIILLKKLTNLTLHSSISNPPFTTVNNLAEVQIQELLKSENMSCCFYCCLNRISHYCRINMIHVVEK